MRLYTAAFAFAGVAILAGVCLAADAPARPQSPSGAAADRAKLPADPKEALAAARWLEKMYDRSHQPESVRMLIAIANGTWANPGGGWFGPCQTRYTWDWLLQHHQMQDAAGISLAKFRGERRLFRRLDRDQDGRITAADLDWSDRNPYIQQAALVNRLYSKINAKRDGKITQDEMLAFFKAAARGKDHITPEDLRDFLLAATPNTFTPGNAPTQEMLVRGLFAGEIGSLNEGPALNETAPDFTLKTPDGKQTVQLAKLLGERPVVLVFGNFTCAPFRFTCQGIEELYQRYKDRAVFAGVYVREAHPTDGWVMVSNKQAGVEVKQPKTYRERALVCTQFCQKVQPTFPFAVDEINDPVGNAYSGMPGRMYVIDPKGKVAYKSGRGPFGFKVGELEQALMMALLEFPPAKKPIVKEGGNEVKKP